MYVRELPREVHHKEWITGKPMVKPPKVATLTGKSDSPPTPSDVIVGEFNIPVLSAKAISVLEEAGVDNIEYFPVKIKDWDTGKIDNSYKIANIIGLIDCLDREHATLRTFDDGEVSSLRRYKLLEQKIVHSDRKKDPPLVFRLGEFRYHVLAHESVKAAFEKNGVTGSEFVPTERFA
jgi:hypothetical protein